MGREKKNGKETRKTGKEGNEKVRAHMTRALSRHTVS